MSRTRPSKKMKATPDDPTALPPLPGLGLVDGDALTEVLCFAGGASMCALAACSRAWKAALIPRQKNVDASGWRSFESMKSLKFKSATFLSARDSEIIDDAALREIAGDGSPLPHLTYIDLSGAQSVSSIGVNALVKGLGSRFEAFRQKQTPRHSCCKDLKVTMTTVKVLAKAPALRAARLTLWRPSTGARASERLTSASRASRRLACPRTYLSWRR